MPRWPNGKARKPPKQKTKADRFWPLVSRSADGCWEWKGSLTRGGYGQFGVQVRGKWVPRRAHRVAWEMERGEIPSGFMVCHRCDNRICVRPDHMFLGTPKDNTDDARAKGRLTGRSSRLSPSDNIDVVTLRTMGARVADLAAAYGVHRMTIYRATV